MQLSDEQAAEGEVYLAFVESITMRLQSICEKHGVRLEIDTRGTLSRYFSIWSIDSDGFNDERLAQVRISCHKQAHAGPDWSFEQTDSENSIRNGMAEIEKLINA